MGKTQKIVALILIVLALALAAYAWVVSNRMAEEQKAQLPRLESVVVAKDRIPAGTLISADMLKTAMFPARPEGAYADLAAVVGKIAAADVAADEAILAERLGGGLRAMLQHIGPDERAIAVRVDEVIAVGNRLAPGDRVDVFATLNRNGTEIDDTQARLLLERLPVLAFGSKDVGGGSGKTGEAGSRASDTPKTAVLAVKITDVDRLVLAANSGHLILALRPHEQPQETTPAAGTSTLPAAVSAPAAAGAASTPPPLTLKRLAGRNPAADTAARAAATPGRPAAAGRRPAGDTILVMHGLNEKRVSLAKGDVQP